MQKNPVGWVEVPVTDLDRAEKWYSDYFGYDMTRQPEKDGMTLSWFPMDEGYGSAGALIHGESYVPSHDGAVLYFSAPGDGLDAALTKAEEQGVIVLLPKMDIGEHGFIAFLQDSEGNRIGIHSMKE